GSNAERASINHGLKAVQIGASAWTAEALKQTMPASVFSRSTECHNQDKVSMGTIAARDCLRVLQLTEQVVAANLIAALQAIRLREKSGEITQKQLGPDLVAFLDHLKQDIDFIDEDKPLEATLRLVISRIQNRDWTLYDGDIA
ncbi:aromatic amino acid lyase, partial [Thalassospira sp.]